MRDIGHADMLHHLSSRWQARRAPHHVRKPLTAEQPVLACHATPDEYSPMAALPPSPHRRRFLVALGTATMGSLVLPALANIPRPRGPGVLELVSLHTGESLAVAHEELLVPESSALPRLQRLLRDHRTGEEHPIDAALYAQLIHLAVDAGVDARYEIISGYRSPTTNARLHQQSSGVATRSLHLEGRALDVRLKGVDCLKLAELARERKTGGVGYYRKSAFVHLDTGRFRTWNG